MKKKVDEFSQIELEEFKYIADRKKEHENRANQMLLFCISSYGAIYGFSDKIQKETIPYLLVFILIIAIRSQSGQQILQNFVVKLTIPLKYLLRIVSSGILCPPSLTLALTRSIAKLTSFNQKKSRLIV